MKASSSSRGSSVLAIALAVALAACTPADVEPLTGSPEPLASPTTEPEDGTDGTASSSAERSPEQVRHVAPDGDDEGPGSAEHPWGTIGHALAQLQAGHTLLVHGGTYEERVDLELSPGRPEAPIVVVAAPGERPVIEGVLWVRNPSYWRFDGIDVTWDDRSDGGDHMVKLEGGRGWVFTGAELSDARSYAALLVAGSPRDWAVRGNCIRDTHPTNRTNQDHLIYVNSGLDAGPGVIERNLLFDAPNGAGIKLGGPREDSGGAADIAVRHNTIVGAAQSLMLSWRARDIVVEGNLLGRTGGDYGAIRSYQLTGDGNVARNNAAFEVATLFLNDEGYPGIEDAGGQLVDVDPRFDDEDSCTGFRPQEPKLTRYGHLAPGGAALGSR
jgi:hypothetical protein